MSYKVVPISDEITTKVRQTLISPQYKHPASVSMATGYGPCRSCLKTFDEGKDERILFTYNSFEGLSDLPLPGPVFIHADVCEDYDESSFPAGLVKLPLLLEGFGCDADMMIRERLDVERIDEQIEQIFGTDEIHFINVRNAEAGCFVARIDRV
ncbi:MAG: DUF1203 domain-containing protein [Acidobacteriota bacterium]